MNREMSKIERGVAIGLCIALFVLLVYRIIEDASFFESHNAYLAFPVSEYMINYQGGFVRRGVLGEILYQIFKVHPYSFPHVILLFDIVVFSVFFIVSFYIFYKKKIFPIMPLTLLNVSGVYGCNRDFLMILWAYSVFFLMSQYLKKRNNIFLFGAIFLSSISILVYEPSFFFIIPILILLYWNNVLKETKTARIFNLLGVFAIPLISMMLVCVSKGNEDIANDIWKSWQPMFDHQGVVPEKTGNAVAFLALSVKQASALHLDYNYGIGVGGTLGCNPLLVLGSLLMFISIYYLIIKIPVFKMRKKNNIILISDICIFQFICLLPMFTILSCDFGRTINYVIYTTFFLAYLIEKDKIKFKIPVIHQLSKRITVCCDNFILSSLCCYMIVLLFMPFDMCCGVSILHPMICEYIENTPLFIPKIQSLFTSFGL